MTHSRDSGIVVTVPTAHVRISPVAFYLRAGELLDAAELLRNHSRRFSSVAVFLYCRAIELALKAYLLARGDTVRVVARRRHDLHRLLIDAFALGIDEIVELTPEERSLSLRISDEYAGNKLAYFEMPGPSELAERFGPGAKARDVEGLPAVARKLVTGVARGCHEAASGDWRPFT